MQTSGMVAIGASVEGALYGSGGAPAAGAGGGAQAQGRAQAQPQQQPRLPGMVAILKDVHTREGWRGLFKGLSMNWIKVGVLGASGTRTALEPGTHTFLWPNQHPPQTNNRAPWRWESVSQRLIC